MAGSKGPASALVLFDIDGTLIRRAGPHHREALVRAVRDVTGLETRIDHIPVQGMLDRDILARMMKDGGAPQRLIRSAMADVCRRAQSIYVRSCPDLARKVCPGARMLLWRLFRKRVPTGLVTGNLSRIAWKKMEHAGLRRYFWFGAFAEAAPDRAGLVRRAVAEARAKGWIGSSARISLVGDHPNDILAARINGIRSVAVATGLSSKRELAEHRPDLLLDDLRHVHLETLLG
jgi:phosphoglycolate phosphatase-like HAD superfamily hydrolase